MASPLSVMATSKGCDVVLENKQTAAGAYREMDCTE